MRQTFSMGTRENLYNLIERGQDGLEELLEILKQSEHPRILKWSVR